ncbi:MULTISPECIES: hypothetical protein [unclassified Paenibacillus]|uniref:Helix-hairpin-helix motif-containing protein n=1 Tax=Paenibacillus provencensis TaxID=441151 RepID=A0ABW3PZX3_9BACL|nr:MULTISPECIES: hypothetical protein [unclassified Paenibacillus]MCM3126934.1 hypothetical protein [Paenibacillus sp. MER 78]SFS57249.1 hypothetical protein SAMN04488601_1011890 [Paenibacillus sp. 453mf]
MIKKIVLTTFVITMISGAFITINSKNSNSAINADSSSSSKPTATNETITTTVSSGTELKTPEETKDFYPLDLSDVGKITTHHGRFTRVVEQTIFDESQIAREMKEIGPKTMQIILDYGIFLREEESEYRSK